MESTWNGDAVAPIACTACRGGESGRRRIPDRFSTSAVVLLLVLAGCAREGGGAGNAPPDTGSASTGSVPPAPFVTDSTPSDTAGGRAAGGPSPSDTAAPAEVDTSGGLLAPSAATLDSLRLEVRRLSEAVTASTRTTDSLLGLLRAREAAPGAPPAVALQRADSAGASAAQGGPTLQEAAQTARSYGLRAFWAVLVLTLTFFVVRASVYSLNALSERSAERRLFFKRLVPIARIVLWAFAIYFVVRVVFAVDARGLLAAAAAVGVAIGFAAQDILKNIFGGLVIVFDQPFQVGDKIQVGDSYGEVVSIGLRSTRIVTPDDSLVSVPNAQVVDSQVSSANSGALDCQVVTDLYLPGYVDEAKAKRIAYQAAASSRYVYLQKPIVVLVKDEFKETFLTHLKVKAYVLDARHEFVFMSDVTERARAEFRRQGLLGPDYGARAWVHLADTGAGNTGSTPDDRSDG